MHLNRIGQSTIILPSRPRIAASAAIAGKKEGEGPLREEFDQIIEDDLFGEETWEKAESRFQYTAANLAIRKAGLTPSQIDAALGGDLLNQIMAASLAVRELHTPFLGLYGACSTMAESLCIASMLVDGGYLQHALCTASSHFCTAERQFRFPLELGTQRPPAAQWTATAAGAMLIDAEQEPAVARVTHGTIGRVIDYQVKDAAHMGAAMAPAVADTIMAHFIDTRRDFRDFDLIATGDLGYIGRNLLKELLIERGVKVDDEKLIDCGASLYYQEHDTHAGGSGCGCVASVSCSWLMKRMEAGELNRLLLVGSGAMLSPTSSQQGQSVPGIASAACIERSKV